MEGLTSVAIGTIEFESSILPPAPPPLPMPFFFFRESFDDIVEATDEAVLNCVEEIGACRVSCLQSVLGSCVTVGI